MKRFIVVCLMGFSFFEAGPAQGSLSLPYNMTDGEQQLVLQLIGFTTSFRPVDNPYPLGGYSGLELGLSMESLSTEDIGYFGSGASVDRNVVFPRLSIGKGIFDNVDIFFNFVPFNEGTALGIYSGALRWGFFQATFVPASFSLIINGTNTNLENVFISQTVGVDLVSGVNVDPLSFYVGVGTLYGQGQFAPSITLENAATNQVGRSFHTMIGINMSLNEVFTALEIDTYSTTTVSFKVGTRL